VVLTLLALGVAALAGGGYAWMRATAIARVRAALPAPPTVADNPTLAALLAHAQRAASRGQPEAVAELARLYHANEFRAEAEACWQLLLREQPGDGRWSYYLADLRRMAGDLAAVEEMLTRTVTVDPAAATAWLQLAEMKLKSGRLAEAAADYQRRLALLPGDPHAELGLARIAHLQGREPETLQRLERLLAAHPKFSAAQNLYAELQAAAGREDLAELHRWLGREAGRFREADDPWMEEVNARCYDPKRLCHLGVIAYQTNQGDRGRARFEQAVALAPEHPLAYQLLGELLLEQGSAQAAWEQLDRGITQARAARPSALHYLRLAEAARVLNRPDLVRRALDDGLKLHPDAPELLHAQGNQLKAEGKTVEAEAAYRRALRLNPAFVEADFALAVLLLETGRPAAAVDALRDALAMKPTFPKALLLLARLELDVGRMEEAGRYLLPLLKANPGDHGIRRIVASWRLQAGQAAERENPAAAAQHYQAGLALQPDDPALRAHLDRLQRTTGGR
jgi:tetratricopeptide (TPR) repeat protein